MAQKRYGYCAVAASDSDIYIVGEDDSCSLELFNTVSICWKRYINLIDMPERRNYAAAVMLQDRYLVVIGGHDKNGNDVASCFIYDCIFNQCSSTPVSMDMNAARIYHAAVKLGGKIIVAGGRYNGFASSMESLGACDLLGFIPLIYPLPTFYVNQIRQLGKAND